VVDASGRRSPAREWLRAAGAPEPRERTVPTGIFYFTRFYRLVGARPPGASTGLIAGDLGWIKLATFPGDADTFSITVGTGTDDEPMRALSDPAVFEAILAAFPQVAPWRARGVSKPIDGPRTPVLVMGGLSNRHRSFVRDGAPLAEGFIPIGDAAYHTNPIYGRGATCAVLAAVALEASLRAHPDDLSAAAVDYDRRTRRDIEPFWEAAAGADRAVQARAAGGGGDLDAAAMVSLATSPRRLLGRLLGWAAGVYFEHGIVPATVNDATVYRAVMRVFNMLDDPRTSLISPAVLARVLPFLAGSISGALPRRRFPGPTRDEALAIVAAVAAKRARRRKRRRAGDAVPHLSADSDVAGHA
jgi:2-polyprenyl-6-methoxyphenol hydroxylase-like FAD-dependent oxidoreductase